MILRLLLGVLACWTLTAQAHEVWIEDLPEGQLAVRFAEYGDEYEKSPGALDSLTLPFAWATPNAESAKAEVPAGAEAKGAPSRERRDIQAGKVAFFEVVKKSDHFLLVNSDAKQAVQIESGFTVMGKPGDPEKPARKPYFYARWQPQGAEAAKPALNFDIVPTGTAGEACVYFRGQPLAGIKLKLYPPAEKEVELTTDEKGLVHFDSTKPGLYLLAGARYRETIAGYFGGKPFDVVSHNTSLAWRQK